MTPLLRVESLVKHFSVRRGLFGRTSGMVQAVDGVSFDVEAGETLALVGEALVEDVIAGHDWMRAQGRASSSS